MTELSSPARRRRRVAIDAAMVLVILVLVVQMWLLTATLESFLAGHAGVALPAWLSSLALFGICVLLYRLVVRLDRMPEPADAQQRPGGAGPWRIGLR
jgi:polyferredoxin